MGYLNKHPLGSRMRRCKRTFEDVEIDCLVLYERRVKGQTKVN
jgi:hypothetical protein